MDIKYVLNGVDADDVEKIKKMIKELPIKIKAANYSDFKGTFSLSPEGNSSTTFILNVHPEGGAGFSVAEVHTLGDAYNVSCEGGKKPAMSITKDKLKLQILLTS